MFLIAIVILESCSRLIQLQGSGGGDYSFDFPNFAKRRTFKHCLQVYRLENLWVESTPVLAMTNMALVQSIILNFYLEHYSYLIVYGKGF